MNPARVQLSRQKGYRKPAGVVIVSRPSKWGNPHAIADGFTREQAVAQYREDLYANLLDVSITDVRRELRGKTLACWCSIGQLCHADVLLKIANA